MFVDELLPTPAYEQTEYDNADGVPDGRN